MSRDLYPQFFPWLGICSSVPVLWAEERKSDSLVKKRSESLKSLFKMSEEWREQFALGHKKGQNCQNHTKILIFPAIHSFFVSDSLKSRVNHSHRSLLKSNESYSLMLLICKERFWAKERRANEQNRANSQPWFFLSLNEHILDPEQWNKIFSVVIKFSLSSANIIFAKWFPGV